jgi:hypothetical protein
LWLLLGEIELLDHNGNARAHSRTDDRFDRVADQRSRSLGRLPIRQQWNALERSEIAVMLGQRDRHMIGIEVDAQGSALQIGAGGNWHDRRAGEDAPAFGVAHETVGERLARIQCPSEVLPSVKEADLQGQMFRRRRIGQAQPNREASVAHMRHDAALTPGGLVFGTQHEELRATRPFPRAFPFAVARVAIGGQRVLGAKELA